jgi:hypothetical protein
VGKWRVRQLYVGTLKAHHVRVQQVGVWVWWEVWLQFELVGKLVGKPVGKYQERQQEGGAFFFNRKDFQS